MALNLSVWEDSGAVVAGHGTTRIEVDNLGFKDSPVDETNTFADYPIRRPIDDELYTLSYKKYYYFKFDGTYSSVSSFTAYLDGDPEGVAGSGIASKIRILYKWTNVYAVPDNTLLDGIFYDPANPPIWNPKLSTVGPEVATSYVTPAPNTTYYTAYLVTQLYIDKSTSNDYGNLEEAFVLNFKIEEPKSGLPDFDTGLINWSP